MPDVFCASCTCELNVLDLIKSVHKLHCSVRRNQAKLHYNTRILDPFLKVRSPFPDRTQGAEHSLYAFRLFFLCMYTKVCVSAYQVFLVNF